MKKFKKILYFLLTAVLGLFAFLVSACSPGDKEMDKNIDVFILAGQSNMEGYARGSTLDDKYKRNYPAVKIYYVGSDANSSEYMNKWTTVEIGQGAIQRYNYFGPEMGMAEVMQSSGRYVAFIKYAFGGSAIYPKVGSNWHGNWDGVKAGTLYEGLFDTVNTAVSKLELDGYVPNIRGFVWMQGETDGDPTFNEGVNKGAQNYQHNLTEFFNAVRAEVNQPDLPIVFGEIYEYSSTLKVANGGRGRDIVAAQRAVGELPNNYLVTTGDLVIDARIDDWHWQGQSAWLLGIRFGEKMYEATYMNTTDDQAEYKDGKVSGKVFDMYGEPLADVIVSCGDKATQTDENGEYSISTNSAVDQIVSFKKENFGSVTRIVRADKYKSGKIKDLETFMHRKAIIQGVVKDSNGTPVPIVSVVCGSQRVFTDKNGKYVLSLFPEITPTKATYEVTFSKDGYNSVTYTHDFGYNPKAIEYEKVLSDIIISAV